MPSCRTTRGRCISRRDWDRRGWGVSPARARCSRDRCRWDRCRHKRRPQRGVTWRTRWWRRLWSVRPAIGRNVRSQASVGTPASRRWRWPGCARRWGGSYRGAGHGRGEPVDRRAGKRIPKNATGGWREPTPCRRRTVVESVRFQPVADQRPQRAAVWAAGWAQGSATQTVTGTWRQTVLGTQRVCVTQISRGTQRVT